MLESIKQILMRRDNLSETESDELIDEAHEALLKYIDAGNLDMAEDICNEYFGIESDCLDDLLY